MPIINAFGWTMLTLDFKYKEKYWPTITEHVFKSHGDTEIKSPDDVEQILKECFAILNQEFVRLIENQRLGSFYIFVHNFHENSIELWKKQLEGIKLPLNENDFAATRRILKIILEQGCGLELKGCPNFGQQLFDMRFEFKLYLEELLYVGYQAICISDFIARSQLFPKTIGLKVVNGDLNIKIYTPYNAIFDHIDADIPKHNNSVEIYNTLDKLKEIWKNDLGVDYGILGSIVREQERNVSYRFSVVKPNDLINYIVNKHGYDEQIVRDFYAGLTISSSNKLSFEDCILRSQDIRRYLYRPIVQLNIDKTNYWIIGLNKWQESITSLTSNALPFGIFPIEWEKYPAIKSFVEYLQNTHDEILENPALDLLENNQFIYDWKIYSITTKNSRNINLNKNGVGDIDIAFLHQTQNIIYVCECKHNRSRFDLFGWRRDYSNFKKYENQLERKVSWIKSHISEILIHFELENGITILNKESYIVKGMFLINAPTIYMYDCLFPTLTLHNFEELLNDNYEPSKFLYQAEDQKEYMVELPYFSNFDQLITQLEQNK